MFVNKPAENRTVDEDRGIELRFVASGPERPNQFVLTVAGVPIGFEATVQTIEKPGGHRTLVWTILNVGHGFGYVQWTDDKSSFRTVPGHRFTDGAERDAVLALIDEAMRVYRDLTGRISTPVEDVVFETAAGRS